MSAWSVKASGVIHQEFEGKVVVVDLALGRPRAARGIDAPMGTTRSR